MRCTLSVPTTIDFKLDIYGPLEQELRSGVQEKWAYPTWIVEPAIDNSDSERVNNYNIQIVWKLS